MKDKNKTTVIGGIGLTVSDGSIWIVDGSMSFNLKDYVRVTVFHNTIKFEDYSMTVRITSEEDVISEMVGWLTKHGVVINPVSSSSVVDPERAQVPESEFKIDDKGYKALTEVWERFKLLLKKGK